MLQARHDQAVAEQHALFHCIRSICLDPDAALEHLPTLTDPGPYEADPERGLHEVIKVTTVLLEHFYDGDDDYLPKWERVQAYLLEGHPVNFNVATGQGHEAKSVRITACVLILIWVFSCHSGSFLLKVVIHLAAQLCLLERDRGVPETTRKPEMVKKAGLLWNVMVDNRLDFLSHSDLAPFFEDAFFEGPFIKQLNAQHEALVNPTGEKPETRLYQKLDTPAQRLVAHLAASSFKQLLVNDKLVNFVSNDRLTHIHKLARSLLVRDYEAMMGQLDPHHCSTGTVTYDRLAKGAFFMLFSESSAVRRRSDLMLRQAFITAIWSPNMDLSLLLSTRSCAACQAWPSSSIWTTASTTIRAIPAQFCSRR
jgi:hypothetical protein